MPIQENPGPANQGPATTFAPTSIAGCALWLDGKDPAGTGTPPSTGATISTWVDKADAKNATATGSPTYLAGGGINFNGSAYFLNQVFTQNLSQRSIFIVMQETVRNNVYGVFTFIPTPSSGSDFGTTTGFSIETSNGLRFYGMNGSYHSDIGNTTLLVKAIYNDNMNGTAGSGFVNGTNVTNVNAGYTAGTCSGYGVASRWLGSISTSYALNGVIYEIIIFNTPLTLANRQNVEGYLAQKWGLTPSLPLGHPGLTTSYVASQPRIFRIGPLPGTHAPFYIRGSIPPPPVQFIQAFIYTGVNQIFTVPATTTNVMVYMWGAGGGGTINYGGAGAMVQGILTVTPGETLNILVGQGGVMTGLTTFGGGGAGAGNQTSADGIGNGDNGVNGNNGSGGGRSAIQRGGTNPTNDVVVAGGGGGGSRWKSNHGGSATFSGTANDGISTSGVQGRGGTQNAGGAGGGSGTYSIGYSGSRGIGGDTYNIFGYNGAGGGGGGYYGGGAGATNFGDGASGGGGSSLTSNLSLIPGQTVLGFNSTNGFTGPNAASPYYTTGVSNGGVAATILPTPGGNGLIVLIYMA